MINLNIETKERFIELYKTVPNPILEMMSLVDNPFWACTLVIRNLDGIVNHTYEVPSVDEYRWLEKEFAEAIYPLADLKRAYGEGAIIEGSYAGHNWTIITSSDWSANYYRIKGGLTIEQWDHHDHEVIHAWWAGDPIEFRDTRVPDGEWLSVDDCGLGRAKWSLHCEYRVALKPCPFCGGKAELNGHWVRDSVAIRCNFVEGGCGASGGFRPTKLEAIKAWNRRVNVCN